METNPSWSLDQVRALLARYKRPEVAVVTQDGPSVVYLPGGKHVIRWLFDLNAQLYRVLELHQIEEYRTHCPDYFRELDPAATCPPCVICRIATQRADWRLQRQKRVLVYGYLCETDQAHAFWQPGQLYLMVGPFRLFFALRGLLEDGVAHQAEQLLAMLNPLMPGPAMVVQVTKGLNGSVKIPALTAQCFPSVALGEWFIPLEHCWIGPEFNLADYHAMLAAVTGAQSTSS